MPERMNQTKGGAEEEPGHLRPEFLICIVLFSFSVFTNTALLVYMKKKLHLSHSPARWLQFAVIMAATLELVFRTAMKIGYYSDRPSWLDTLWFCYPMFMFYQGIPYGVHVCILLLTVHCLLITRRYNLTVSMDDIETLGFSQRQIKWMLFAVWVGCFVWSAIELYALGEGLYMRNIHTKPACALYPKTLRVATLCYMAILPGSLITIAALTVMLGVGLRRNADVRAQLSQVVVANIALLLLGSPFLVQHVMGVFYSWPLFKDTWFALYFMMKSTYLVVPLLWFLRPPIIIECLQKCMVRCRASRTNNAVQREASTLLNAGN